MSKIENVVKFMEEMAADDTHGYAQDKRDGSPDYDCSSFIGTALYKSGFNVNPLSTTRNLYNQLITCGFKEIDVNNSRCRGDIFLTPGKHVVMCIDKDNIVHASINENGTTKNGKPGDQTGKEICTRTFYVPSYGWTYHLRYINKEQSSNVSTSKLVIDISHHNIITNWDLLKKTTDSIIIRAGYMSYQSGTFITDKKFIENIKEALKYNMHIGIYAWDQSLNENEAIAFAKYIINLVNPFKIVLPIYIDSEAYKNNQGRADNISKEQRTKNIIAFCETVRKAGYISGVYASDSWFKSKIDFKQINKYEIWCARYSKNKPTIDKYDSWQYGSEQFSWATAPIDTNYFYKEYGNTTPLINHSPSVTETLVTLMGKINTSSSNLNIRSSYSSDSSIIGKYSKNEIVQLIAKTSNGWYRTDKGYISSDYVIGVQGEVFNCSKLNIRSSATSDIDNNKIGVLSCGDTVRLLKDENGWYKILTDNNVVGYASKNYIKILG